MSAHAAARAWQALASVMDPELPQLSVIDLGMIRSVEEGAEGGAVRVGVAPTYCGCPALRLIHERIRAALHSAGIARIEIHDVMRPAWTSAWITERGRTILRECGIAPPLGGAVRCPRCGNDRTERVAAFGSTPCTAQYRCLECLEPFEHFKCI